ncbi:MAG: hypothetical protein IPM13_05765 [Phycisphaerales bacterium]|nr:hypothetical protein [Phycisphaerales bacterium]
MLDTARRTRSAPSAASATRGPVVSILIADAALSERVKALVESAGLESRSYEDTASLIAEFPRREPSCLVLGAQVGERPAPDILAELSRRGLRVPTLVVTSRPDVAGAVAAMRAGAADVLEAGALSQQLVGVVQRAISADLCERIADLEAEAVRQRYASLTRREREVLQFVVQGETSSGIAAQLGLREKTVEIYRSHINKKMQARNAAELTKLMLSLH